MDTYYHQAIHYSSYMDFVGPFPPCVFRRRLGSIHGEVEVRHQFLKDIVGNPGACSSSVLRHVVIGMRLARVLATMLGPP